VSALLPYVGWPLAAVAGVCATVMRLRLLRHLALVADAGHELRGPLCAAQLGLEGLAGDAAAARRAAAIELELRRASLALDDLAAACWGRRAGERPALVDVGELLVDAGHTWRSLAHACGAELAVVPPAGPALVHADPLRLAQACGNLVANAVEHGGSPVRVRGRVTAACVRVEVEDGGPGLPRPVGELIARRNRRSARGRGLAITARIAERHGGRLASAPSRAGARLVLELPRVEG
jgi:signal transduction histidine kinase